MKLIGIYRILCLVNSRAYIGASVNTVKRCKSHVRALNTNRHPTLDLQRDWNKYGKQKFVLSTLENCTYKQLDSREVFWIKQCDAIYHGYNTSLRPYKIYKVTEQGRKKHSVTMKALQSIPEFRAKLRKPEHIEAAKAKLELNKSIGKINGAKQRKEASERLHKLHKDPKFIAKLKSPHKRQWASVTMFQKNKDGVVNTPKQRQDARKRMKALHQNKKFHQALIKRLKENNPNKKNRKESK